MFIGAGNREIFCLCISIVRGREKRRKERKKKKKKMGLFSNKGSRANSVASDNTGKSSRKGSTTSANSLRSTASATKMSLSGNSYTTLPPLPASASLVKLPPAPNPQSDPAGYLRSIYAVRETSRHVFDAALKGRLTNFNVDMTKFQDVVSYVVSIIKVCLLFSIDVQDLCLILLNYFRETMLRILKFRHMVGGSISRLEEFLE